MKQFVLTVILLLGSSIVAIAQDTPAAEVFGGYSYLRCDSGGSSSCNLNGWTGSVAINANKVLGIVADFSGQYGKIENAIDVKAHSFLFGPKISARTGKATPFVHALFGVTHVKLSALGLSDSTNDFAMALGGGLDFTVGRIAIRPVQLEYFMTRDSGETGNHLRYCAGIVFKLGKR